VIAGLFAFSGCGAVEEKAKESASYVQDTANKVAEAAGEVTANWLGSTVANVDESYNEAIVERLKYVEISVDKIDYEIRDKKKGYTIELTFNSTAPDEEKTYVDMLFDDNYIVACDRNDYVYNLSPYRNEDDEYYGYDDFILPGQSHLTVYTELNEADEIVNLQYIDKKISLP
jgi:hypothetical protein